MHTVTWKLHDLVYPLRCCFASMLIILVGTAQAETVTRPTRQFGLGVPYSSAWSPDEKVYATGDMRGTVHLWNAETGELLHTLTGHQYYVEGMKFSPNGKQLITSGYDYQGLLWDVETGARLMTFSHVARKSVVFSPNSEKLLIGDSDGNVRVWSVLAADWLTSFTGHKGSITSMAFSPEGKRVLTGSWDKTARLWDAETGQVLQEFIGHTMPLVSVAFSPEGKQVVTGAQDYTIRLWNAETGAQQWRHYIWPSTRTNREVTSVAFTPDGSKLVTSQANYWRVDAVGGFGLSDPFDYESIINYRDLQTGDELTTISGHTDIITSLSFSADGTHMLTGSRDGTMRQWDAESGQALRTWQDEHTAAVSSVDLSSDGSKVLTGSRNGTCRVWDARTGALLLTIQAPSPLPLYVNGAEFSPDDSLILTSHLDGRVRIWNTATGDQATTLTIEPPTTAFYLPLGNSATFSSDGTKILTAGQDGLKVWDTQSGQVLSSVDEKTYRSLLMAVFTPDGSKWVVVPLFPSMSQAYASVWDANTAGYLSGINGLHGLKNISAVAISPNGKQYLFGSVPQQGLYSSIGYGITLAWDTVQKNTTIMDVNWPSHYPKITDFAYSPDGNKAVIGNGGGEAALWDFIAKKCQHIYVGSMFAVNSVDYSRDGQFILTGGADGTAMLWSTDPPRNSARDWQLFE